MLSYGILRCFQFLTISYLHEMATKNCASWSELSIMEWESNLSTKDQSSALKAVESSLSAPSFNDPTSPASIVLFSALYGSFSTAKLSDYPSLQKFFIGFLDHESVKTGIELASAHTAEQKVDASTVPGASSTPAPLATGARQLKQGIFANKLDGKRM
jgi:hypothetical protein